MSPDTTKIMNIQIYQGLHYNIQNNENLISLRHARTAPEVEKSVGSRLRYRNMNEILIVPDVHGRRFWRSALDYPGQIIFLGDYFDPYPEEGIGVDEAYENFLDIVEFKAENTDTLLIGNHELGYFDPAFKYSCKERAYYDEMNGIL